MKQLEKIKKKIEELKSSNDETIVWIAKYAESNLDHIEELFEYEEEDQDETY